MRLIWRDLTYLELRFLSNCKLLLQQYLRFLCKLKFSKIIKQKPQSIIYTKAIWLVNAWCNQAFHFNNPPSVWGRGHRSRLITDLCMISVQTNSWFLERDSAGKKESCYLLVKGWKQQYEFLTARNNTQLVTTDDQTSFFWKILQIFWDCGWPNILLFYWKDGFCHVKA
jgi:hypothetical protein